MSVSVYLDQGAEIVTQVRVTPDANGYACIPPVESALDKTVWVFDAKGAPLEFSVEDVERTEEAPYETTLAFLVANRECKMVDRVNGWPVVGLTDDAALIVSSGNVEVVKADAVRVVEPKSLKQTKRTRERVMKIKCASADPQDVRISYVSTAISWSPSYHVEINGDKANVTLVAEVRNEAEDVVGIDVRFATHMPNLSHKTSSLSNKKEPEAKKPRVADRGRGFGDATAASAMVACIGSVQTVQAGADTDVFEIVVPNATIRKSQSSIPLLHLTDLPVSYIYKMDSSESAKCARYARIRNTSARIMLAASGVILVDGACVGERTVPRAPAGDDCEIRLYSSHDVSTKLTLDAVTGGALMFDRDDEGGIRTIYLGDLSKFQPDEVAQIAAAHGQRLDGEHPLWSKLLYDETHEDHDERLVPIKPLDFLTLPKIDYVLDFW